MYNDKYFLVVIACGHVGKWKSIEVSRYFKSSDVLSCFEAAYFIPRSKKKSDSIKIIKEITEEEYEIGKVAEQNNLYLNTFDTSFIKKVIWKID